MKKESVQRLVNARYIVGISMTILGERIPVRPHSRLLPLKTSFCGVDVDVLVFYRAQPNHSWEPIRETNIR
jgi:hypothetical protein